MADRHVVLRERAPAPEPEPTGGRGRIRVLVAVRHQMGAGLVGYRLAGEPDLDVTAQIWTLPELLPAIKRLRPDVALVDIALLDGNVGPTCRQIRTGTPMTRLAILTAESADRAVMDAVEAGCSAFAAIGRPDADLITAVRSAHSGQPHLDPALVAGLVQRLDRTQRQTTAELTGRELEVLGLLARGLGNAAVGERLGVSVNTVRHHVQSILTKLGVHTKLQAVTLALREGLISAEAP